MDEIYIAISIDNMYATLYNSGDIECEYHMTFSIPIV